MKNSMLYTLRWNTCWKLTIDKNLPNISIERFLFFYVLHIILKFSCPYPFAALKIITKSFSQLSIFGHFLLHDNIYLEGRNLQSGEMQAACLWHFDCEKRKCCCNGYYVYLIKKINGSGCKVVSEACVWYSG